MNLIQLIRKYLLIAILIVFPIGCISHFLIFRFFIHYSSDQILNDQKKRIENYVAENDTLPLAAILVLKPARIEEREIDEFQSFSKEIFKDTLMYNEETGTLIPYRQLNFTVFYSNEYHLISINQPTVISNDLFYAIISSLLVLLILFILFTYILEYFLKKTIWKPLNYNLQRLQEYNLKVNATLELINPGIIEFDEMNKVIRRMVEKINTDYENSRLFTEDASHEMQTPLSIIRSKIDLLMQNSSIMENSESEKFIKAISRAVSRLSKLNKSLLLITKINNNQYAEKKNFQLNKRLKTYLSDLQELFEAKKITVKTNIKTCTLNMNPDMAEIMLSNLLSNAIRHNLPNGWIDIFLDESRLIISNSYEGEQETTNLFNRITFYNTSEDSVGLGLNIIKSICDKNDFSIQYNYPEENIFRIIITFN